MPRELSNAEIADRLELFAALLDLDDAPRYAARAYRRAADLIRALPTSAAELVRSGRVRELRGVGPGIESRLRELVETGEIAQLRALERELAPDLVAFGRLVGLGSRRTVDIARALGIHDAAGLKQAIEDGRLTDAPGVAAATEAKIRAALAGAPRALRGLTLDRSLALSEAIADALGARVAGPARRFAELSHELAVVGAAEDPEPVVERFATHPAVLAVLERAQRRALGVTLDGVPVTLVVAEPGSFGTELVRATGSPEWVAAHEPLPDVADEDAVFARLGLAYRPPELRELDASPPLAPLVDVGDVRGDLHCHTTWSDGRASVLEMGEAALARGYEYLAICDHTPNVGVVKGLTGDELRRQAEEISQANERLAPFRLLRGVECDLRADGSLDVADEVLAELEWVQLSLHAGQRRPAHELTKIVSEAMRHPAVRALSHPKGRILNHRPENALDLDEVFAVALETGVALEVNGLPDRLDLSSTHVREALAAGVRLVLNSDAHSTRGLRSLELAVATARRGGATADSVVNCGPLAQVLGR
jgi:DNA polymerase (family 10)